MRSTFRVSRLGFSRIVEQVFPEAVSEVDGKKRVDQAVLIESSSGPSICRKIQDLTN